MRCAPTARKSPELESERVALAILKLSEGDLQKLSEAVRSARTDYRDVLAWASILSSLLGLDATPETVRAARARDREQYLRWLDD